MADRIKWCPKCHHTLDEHSHIDGCLHGSGDGIVDDAPDRCNCDLTSDNAMRAYAGAMCITIVVERD